MPARWAPDLTVKLCGVCIVGSFSFNSAILLSRKEVPHKGRMCVGLSLSWSQRSDFQNGPRMDSFASPGSRASAWTRKHAMSAANSQTIHTLKLIVRDNYDHTFSLSNQGRRGATIGRLPAQTRFQQNHRTSCEACQIPRTTDFCHPGAPRQASAL